MDKTEDLETKPQKSSALTKYLMGIVLILAVCVIAWCGYVLAKPRFDVYKRAAVVITLPGEKIEKAESEQAPVKEIFADEIETVAERVAIEPVMVAENEPQTSKEIFEDEVLPETAQNQSPEDAAVVPDDKNAYIAVVIDDAGASHKHTQEVIAIDAPLTLAFLPDSEHLTDLLNDAVLSNHEIMVHVPMQPRVEASLEEDTLKVSMEDDVLKEHFLRMLSVFDGYDIKGVNNHMGSFFTESASKLDVVMRVLKQRGLFFLDSKTTPYSQVEAVGALDDVPVVSRDVFLDNNNNYQAVMKQLKKAEKIAKKNGSAIVIGHPKSETIKAVADWAKTLENKDVKLVYLSRLVDMQNKKN